jgi:integrase
MGQLAMKGVYQKGGRTYYRRKIGGKDVYLRLPDPADPGFAEAYGRAATDAPERPRPGAGTIAALVAGYRASGDYRAIPSAVTRRNYARYLDMLALVDGHRTVRGIAPYFVRRMRDRYQDTPGKANNWLKVFKALLSWAALNDWRRDNPAAEVKLLPLGEHEPWPADVLDRALAAASPMLRLIIVTGLCSGARVGDAIRMQHGWHDGRIMEFVASKNRAHVAVPMHPFWLAELARQPRKAVTLLYDRSGRPFGSTGAVQAALRRLMKDIGSPTYVSNGRVRNYTFHGLRKNACCYLAELGLSDREIGTIVGMSEQTVRHYTRRARALMIAQGAAERIVKGDVIRLKGGRAQIASE